MQQAQEKGMSKEKLTQMIQSFAILELGTLNSKINEKNAESLSKIIKESAWQKTKMKLKL